MPEHHCCDLGFSTYVEADEIPVTPSGVDALANCSLLILRLSLRARHSAAPGEHAGAIPAFRLARIAAMLGLCRGEIDGAAIVGAPFDMAPRRKAAVSEMALR